MGKKLRLTELIVEASFMKRKRDAEYQAEALRMKKELPKIRARAKVYDDMEGIDLGIGKNTEVFSLKKFENNEVTLPNASKDQIKTIWIYNVITPGKVSIINLTILE